MRLDKREKEDKRWKIEDDRNI